MIIDNFPQFQEVISKFVTLNFFGHSITRNCPVNKPIEVLVATKSSLHLAIDTCWML